jgi:hypothetical protein
VIRAVSPLHLLQIAPTSRPHLAHISPTSRRLISHDISPTDCINAVYLDNRAVCTQAREM